MSAAALPICPSCEAPGAQGARFCRACGTALFSESPPSFEPPVPPRPVRAADGAGAIKGELSHRIERTWGMHMMRTPLVALIATLAGVYLPWVSTGGTTISVSTLTNGWMPIAIGLVLAASLVAYATVPSRPEPLLMVVCGVAFVVSVLAVVLTAIVWAGTHLASSAVELLGDLASGSGTDPDINLGFGAYVTTAASVTLLLSTLRLLRHYELPRE